MRFPRHDLHTLTGVYALDAIDGPERDRFEHHLHRCRPCDNEVRGLTETATRLAMAAAMAPPSLLKQRVLTAAGAIRQLPPDTERRRARPAPGPAWTPRIAAVVAAAALAVACALGAIDLSTRHQLDNAQAQNQAIAAVLAAPDARIATQVIDVGGTATVVVSRSEREIVFTASGLRPPPAGKVYELWLMGPPRVRKAGLLPAPRRGKTAPVLASGLATGDKIGVTTEPAGGTSRPTTTPILVMSLPA